MKTILNNTKRYSRLLLLPLLLLLTVGLQFAHAQTDKQIKTFKVKGQNIEVSYTAPVEGVTIFTITNKTGRALKSGEYFTIDLPALNDQVYDLAEFQKKDPITGLLSPPVITISKEFLLNDIFSFSVKTVTGGIEQGNSTILFFKK